MNQKHVPLGVVVKDKKRTFAFGSNSIKEYLQNQIRNDAAVTNCFKTDKQDLNNATNYDYYPVPPGTTENTSLIASLGPALLPCDVEFMNFEEMCNWLINEIVQDAARRGHTTKTNQIKFRDPRFKTVWWPEEIWAWGNTIHFRNMSKRYWRELGLPLVYSFGSNNF